MALMRFLRETCFDLGSLDEPVGGYHDMTLCQKQAKKRDVGALFEPGLP